MEKKLSKVDRAIFDVVAQMIHTAIGNCCSEEDFEKIEARIERLSQFADSHSV